MRVFSAIAIAFFSLLSNPSFAADDLFSEIAMESPYQKTVATSASGNLDQVLAPARVTGLSTLSKTLEAAGFEPKMRSSHVLVETKQGDWEFPFYLSVAVEEDELSIELPVVTINPEKKLDGASMLKLLQAGDGGARLYFSYSKEKSNIRLRHTISNRSVSPGDLKRTIDSMADFAAEHADAWSQFTAKSSPAAMSKSASAALKTTPASNTANPVATKPAVKKEVLQKLTLVGLWSAVITDDEAFAIRIQSDRRFQLVHLKAGKTNVSNGIATKAEGQLTLKGDEGVTIVGALTQTANSAFQFDINGTDGQVALSMKFKKSK